MGRRKERERIELDFSWMQPRFELRWLLGALLLCTTALYEVRTWKSCSNNIEYNYYKDHRVSKHAACTHDAEMFRHRPEFAEQCESAVRSTNAEILNDNKWKCLWSEQPISLGKWELLAMLAVSGYVSLRFYTDYRRRIEEKRIYSRESRRALEYMYDATANMPQFEFPRPFKGGKSNRVPSGVHIEPYDSD